MTEGVACAHPKAVVAFKKLPHDPRHMKTSEALQFLEFIQAHQKEHPDNIFKFHHWIDENKNLQESMEGKYDADG
ncbi:hypothetical protein PAXRUDRAFT_20274 [Paxillus rubicundulus Ve08.2h10]|uniref:Uncharacterized protein n=1 Tax=Paxillus rubicundulus Ve08.2h10 TaxID=930991 RepID=A0A0D0BRC2_9AGAM|nr:hypothetical protein PAXRUDRAFT_20274 [Paxillus rubicundulus Ve08.2h10]